MSDDGWKGGTDPQAYVDSLKQDALTMVEQVDSGFTPENLAEAELLWANLPVGNRSWTGLATHEKALVCHTVQRLRIAAEARGMAEAYQLGRADLATEATHWLKNPAQAVMEKERQPIFDEAANLASASMDAWASKEFEKLPIALQFDVERLNTIRVALNGGQHE
jgi:hypothetical protein